MKLAKINIHSPAFLILVAFLGCIFTFFFNMFMTRHTTAAIYGDFSLAKQFLSLGSNLCIFGTSASFMPNALTSAAWPVACDRRA